MNAVDMHCDTVSKLWILEKRGEKGSLRENSFHVDLTKLQKGGYSLQNFAVFVERQEGRDPLVDALEMTDVYYRALSENSDWIAPVFCYRDILENERMEKLSAMLTVEEGAVLKGNPYILRVLYQLGVRMLTLTWNYENELGYPGQIITRQDYDPSRCYGLKPAGIEVVQEMNRLGMIVDVSHLSDDGFWDVVRYSGKPFVASHSNSRRVCSHSRNLTDEMIRALAEKGGVMGLNFYGEFLSDDRQSTVDAIVRHIRHIVCVGGIGCIGLGTDFDGIDGELELKDASFLPVLERALRKEGFTETELEAIFRGNVLRVYREVLKG